MEWWTLVRLSPDFKNNAQNSPKHATSSENFIFFLRGLAPPQTHPLVDSTLAPNQAFWIHQFVPQSSNQIYAYDRIRMNRRAK